MAKSDPDYEGALIFSQRCGGCHTLDIAGTQGSGNRTLRQQGPNLDQRSETFDIARFAIANGGISGSIMPQNIVVGKDADKVAQFVADYAGTQANDTPRPSPSQDESVQQKGASKPNQGATANYDSQGS